ncbi:MAG: NADPH:quinone reductase [Acidimicrobiia bacterium]|nr:NADPH:quinone reductase [Acidimicrobiia bacterium]
MQAIVVRQFGGPEVLRLENVAAVTPGPGQVLVRVRAAGVNPVDTYIRTGTYPVKPALPYTPGLDLAGVVDAIGPEVATWKPGDRVYSDGIGPTSGGCAEFAVCAADRVHALPERVSFAQGAALGVPYATAWRALFTRAHAQAGDTILVHGASGGVGTAAVQIARAHGLHVIGTAGTPEGLALVREQGAHAALDHRDPGYLDEVKALTGGRGVDIVLEMLANVNLDRDLEAIAKGGRVMVVGNRGRVEIDPRKCMSRDGAILGMTLFNATPADLTRIHAGLRAGIENGALSPVIGRELPLAEAAEAHRLVMAPGARGKIVLLP